MATKIDFRLKKQRFKCAYSNFKEVYVHKNGPDSYAIGINGTSMHESGIPKDEVSWKVTHLRIQRL